MTSFRYGQLAGNVGQAVAAFAVAYLLLQQAPVADYAVLSFILLIQAFGISLTQALIGSPLLIMLHAQPPAKDGPVLMGFVWLAAGIAIGVAAVQLGFVIFATQVPGSGVMLALASALQVLRFALRSYWLNRQPAKVVQSDLLQCSGVLMLLLYLFFLQAITLTNISLVLVLATLLALAPLLTPLWRWLRLEPDWAQFKQGLRQQGKPAALGVLTVELTANFHCYFVMLMSGSQAFAAIAAATLFFRPQAVILQSLQQSDRAALVQAWMGHSVQQLQQIMRSLRRMAICAFFVNVAVIVLLLYWQPAWLWPDATSRKEFQYALLLWSVIALLRSARLPLSTALQAADQFQPLARATYLSATVTIPAVCIGWWLGGSIVSLFGVLCGEMLLAVVLRREFHSVMSSR